MPINIASESVLQALVVDCVETTSVDSEATVKPFRQRFDNLADTKVAYAHFAQRFVKSCEHLVEEELCHRRGDRGVGSQPAHHQCRVKRNHIEPTVRRVRHAEGFVEDSGSGLGKNLMM
jgi:hypothetical protein